MNDLDESHPLIKLMETAKGLCEKNYLLTRPSSPLSARVTPSPTCFSHSELSTVLEEENEQQIEGVEISSDDNQSPPPHSARTLNLTRAGFKHIRVTLDEMFKVLEDFDVLGEVALNSNYYYEDYKALTLYLEYFYRFTNDDNLTTSEALKLSPVSARNSNLQENRIRNEKEKEIFLKTLVTTYVFHLLMEKTYVDYLRINYDPAVSRLDKNALVLFEMMKTYINPPIWEYIQKKGVPKVFQRTIDTSESNHPFRYIVDLDQRAMIINAKRLFLVRFRRFYLSLVACFVGLRDTATFNYLESWLPGIISLGNIIYYLPRILTDWANLIYQVVILKPKGENVSTLDLFKIHFSRRFDLIFRDLLWFSNGVISFFVLTGGWVGGALYLNMLVQWTEMFLNLWMLLNHKNHLNKMPNLLEGLGLPRNHQKMQVIEQELNRRCDIDFNIIYARMINSVIISMTSMMILPLFNTISVYIALVGSVIALCLSYLQYYQSNMGLQKRKSIPEKMFSCPPTSESRAVSCATLVQN